MTIKFPKHCLYSIKVEGAEECLPIEYFQDVLKYDDHRLSLELEVWKSKFGTGTFWCTYHGEGFESGEDVCGNSNCGQYKPRNGKSGRCCYHSAPHVPTGQTITIEK